MASYYHQTKEQAFKTWKKVYISKDKSEQEIYSTVKASDMQESYWVKLKDPNKFKGVEGELSKTRAASPPCATCGRCSSRSTSGSR